MRIDFSEDNLLVGLFTRFARFKAASRKAWIQRKLALNRLQFA